MRQVESTRADSRQQELPCRHPEDEPSTQMLLLNKLGSSAAVHTSSVVQLAPLCQIGLISVQQARTHLLCQEAQHHQPKVLTPQCHWLLCVSQLRLVVVVLSGPCSSPLRPCQGGASRLAALWCCHNSQPHTTPTKQAKCSQSAMTAVRVTCQPV